MDNNDLGFLLNSKNLTYQRKYFVEMAKMLGIRTIHRAPREGKTYNGYGELDTFYYEPEPLFCIFEENPDVRTMKKLGWDSQLADKLSLISVPYDLNGLQKGSLFIIPDPFSNVGRLFRVEKMSSIMIYPASITCALSPVFETEQPVENVDDFVDSNFNLLEGEEEIQ